MASDSAGFGAVPAAGLTTSKRASGLATPDSARMRRKRFVTLDVVIGRLNFNSY